MVERQGSLVIDTITENGIVLTRKHGFTVSEQKDKVLSFDGFENEEYGNVLLFGDQVFFLKFWDTEDVEKALDLVTTVLGKELQRRKDFRG